MSLEFNKNLNKPGLSGSFGAKKKSTGVSSQAARNLASGTAANKTSLFSLKGTRKNNFVAGQSFKADINKYNYQGMRASLNSRSYTPSSADYTSSFSMPNQININSGNNAFMKGQIIGGIINNTFGLLNEIGVFDNLKGGGNVGGANTNGSNIDAALGSLTGRSVSGAGTGVSGVISGMESATDSATLRSAIGEARGEYTNLSGMSGIYQDAATKAESSMNSLETGCDKAEKGVDTAKGELGKANQTTKALTQTRDNAKNAVSKADSAYGQAVDKYTQAHDTHTTAKTNHSNAQAATSRAQASYDQAQATLNSTPETIPDANGNPVKNPAYAQAETAFKNAKTQLEQAKQAEKNAKAELDSAADAEAAAEKAKTEAYNNLGDKKAAVDAAEEKLTKAQENLDNAKEKEGAAKNALNIAEENYTQATTILQSAESAVEQFKVHKKNVETLKKAIEKQETRLSKLEEKEQDKYDKYDEKAQKGIEKNENRNAEIFSGNLGRNGNNDPDTVDTFRERMASNRMERTNDRVKNNLNKRDAYASNVSDTQYIQEQARNGKADFIVGGQKYQKLTTPSGSEVYCRDGSIISEEEYNIGRKQAGLGS